jgi:hypothetical protein
VVGGVGVTATVPLTSLFPVTFVGGGGGAGRGSDFWSLRLARILDEETVGVVLVVLFVGVPSVSMSGLLALSTPFDFRDDEVDVLEDVDPDPLDDLAFTFPAFGVGVDFGGEPPKPAFLQFGQYHCLPASESFLD